MAEERKTSGQAAAKEKVSVEERFSKNEPGSSLMPKRTTQFYRDLEETESGLSYQSGSGGMEAAPMHPRRQGEESFKGAPSVMAGNKPRSGNPEGVVKEPSD